MVQVTPEQHILSPTLHVPNSKLPILVYKNAIPDVTQASAEDLIQANKWIKGGQWKGYPVVHFHSNTHECYIVLSGNATYELGKSPVDPVEDEVGQKIGMRLDVTRGDVFVLPAGVSHASIEFNDEYEFIGFYPEKSPHWDMNFAKENLDEITDKVAACEQVPIPEHDPIYGTDGPLPRLWRENRDPGLTK